jgi:hypothetical protein
MVPKEERPGKQKRLRRDLVKTYVRLQRELAEADPLSSSYQATIHAFRQMGYTLIASGFEDDLDRLLRLRILDGGRDPRVEPEERSSSPELLVLERRLL